MSSPANLSPHILVVDYDGRILYALEWQGEQYAIQRYQPETAPPTPAPRVAQAPSTAVAETTPEELDKEVLVALQNVLYDLKSACIGIVNAVIVSPDGHVWRALTPTRADAMGIAITTMRQFAKQADTFLDCGLATDILLRDSSHLFIFYPAENLATLGVLIPADSNVGLFHWACREAANKITAILKA